MSTAALQKFRAETFPPWIDNLPIDDGEPLETNRHRIAMNALIDSVKSLFQRRKYTDYVTGGNMFIFYPEPQTQKKKYRGPDFFAVLNVDGSYSREYWHVPLEHHRYPDVIIELMSDTTADVDLGEKKDIYEQIFQTPEYFVFDPQNPHSLQGWRLTNNCYQAIQPNQSGWLWCESLSLWVGTWYGVIDHEPPQDECVWLRFYDKDKQLVLLPEEQEKQEKEQERQEKEQERQEKEQERQEKEWALRQASLERKRKEWAQREASLERQRADQEQERAENEQQQKELALIKVGQERQRADKLAEKLRALGINPDEIT
jgi:Uma2 family endonuclease